MSSYDTRKRKNIQLCYPFDEERLKKWGYPVFVQPKLDGERCRVVNNGNSWLLLSSTEELILSMPHITEALNKLDLNPGFELDGELYRHGLPFEEIHSRISRTVNPHPDAEEIQLHLFDLVDEKEEQFFRFRQLRKLPIKGPSLQLLEWSVANDFNELWAYYEAYVERGYEGIIVRHPMALYLRRRSTYVMKFKPKQLDTYQVIGKEEEIDKYGNPKGTLGALICSAPDTKEKFRVGSGFSQEQRRTLWQEDLTGFLVQVQYQNTTPGKGVPRFPVFFNLIDPKEGG